MNFDTVETGGDSVARCLRVVRDPGLDFGDGERSRCWSARERGGAAGNNIVGATFGALQHICLRSAAQRPQLAEDERLLGVDSVGDLPPSRDLSFIPDPRHVVEAAGAWG